MILLLPGQIYYDLFTQANCIAVAAKGVPAGNLILYDLSDATVILRHNGVEDTVLEAAATLTPQDDMEGNTNANLAVSFTIPSSGYAANDILEVILFESSMGYAPLEDVQIGPIASNWTAVKGTPLTDDQAAALTNSNGSGLLKVNVPAGACADILNLFPISISITDGIDALSVHGVYLFSGTMNNGLPVWVRGGSSFYLWNDPVNGWIISAGVGDTTNYYGGYYLLGTNWTAHGTFVNNGSVTTFVQADAAAALLAAGIGTAANGETAVDIPATLDAKVSSRGTSNFNAANDKVTLADSQPGTWAQAIGTFMNVVGSMLEYVTGLWRFKATALSQAPAGNAIVLPGFVSVQNNAVTTTLPPAYQNRYYQTTFPVVDAKGNPINLTGVDLTIDFYLSETPDAATMKATTTGSPNGTIAINGNQCTVTLPHTITTTVGNFKWILSPTADNANAYTSGTLVVNAAPPV